MIKSADLKNEVINLSKELVLVDTVNLPFTSALLRKGTQRVGSVIVDWKYENLDNNKTTAIEGADVSSFQNSNRSTGDKNICQIISKAVNISGTASAVNLEGINDIFTHELQNRMLEAKRDLEYYLINGKYTEESGHTPRQMKGVVSFAEANKIEKSTLDIKVLNEMAKKMKKNGTSSQDMLLLCDYNTMDIVSELFADKTTYLGITNEFGSPAMKINLTYGSAIVTLVDSMPQDTCILVNMNYLKLAELRPMQYADLSKTGDSRKGFIVMENTLKLLNPNAVQMFHKK